MIIVDSSFLILLLISALIGTGIGAAIGSQKDRTLDGAILGFLLGPIGWLIVALSGRPTQKAPEVPREIREALWKQRLADSDPVNQWRGK